jgi:hypothetical protein
MVDINWVMIGIGFAGGVFASYLVSNLVFNTEEKYEVD